MSFRTPAVPLAFVALLAVSSCAARSRQASATAVARALTFETIDGRGVIYVKRASALIMNIATNYDIYMGPTRLGLLGPGDFFRVEVVPGSHDLSMRLSALGNDAHTIHHDIQVKAGEILFLSFDMGNDLDVLGSGRGKEEMVDGTMRQADTAFVAAQSGLARSDDGAVASEGQVPDASGLAPLAPAAKQAKVGTLVPTPAPLFESSAPPRPPTSTTPSAAGGFKVRVLLEDAEMQRVNIAKIAVPTVRGSGIEQHIVDVLTETAVEAASVSPKLSVIGSNDINAMLGFEKQKELIGCDDLSCMADIAGALGVDAILNVTAGKVGSTYRISATLVETAKARAIVRGSVKSKDLDALIYMVEALIPAVVQPVIK